MYIYKMFKTILKNSIDYMKQDHKIIRLTLTTSFFHSLIASLLIILNVNTLFARHYENGLYVGKVAEFFVQKINQNHIINRVIIISILLFLAYSIIYPIGQSALIYYVNDETKSINNALKKGKTDFFAMFEFGIISLLISPTVYRITVLKIAVSGKLHGTTTILILLLWFGAMNIINCLKIYTRYIITIEKKWLYDALLKSISLTMSNLKENFKYMRIQTMLLLNFSLNILIIYAIPLLLIYIAIISNLIDNIRIKWIVYSIFFVGILFGAYASAIVRAFFVYFWQKIYDNLIQKRHT